LAFHRIIRINLTMPVAIGSRLGPYEVTVLIGEGGMGKVWRAHHTALHRDDAVKAPAIGEAWARAVLRGLMGR
jgi:serine/threonine protein kinase